MEIDLTNPKLGAELLKNAKGGLPIDVWRIYVLQHSHRAPSVLDFHPASVISWCDERHKSTVDPQKAVDETYHLLVNLFFAAPPRSRGELMQGIWDAQLILFRAHSDGRKRGQPSSIQNQAVRAFVIRKFNPHPKEKGESSVSWARLADLLLLENGKCPRNIHDDEGRLTLCGVARHRYDSRCVKALMTAVNHLHSAMKHDGIPV